MIPFPLDSIPLLNPYREERGELLRSIITLLENDPQVKAAWLFGSLGRGTGDALSDIDLFVIVDDLAIDAIMADPGWITARVGHPILSIEAPQNAPEGGAYLMTCYDAPTAPHIVDWYWQPLSLASIPPQVQLLFEKARLPHTDQPTHFPGGPARVETIEQPIHFLSFFWIMLMITAKQACRAPRTEEMALLPHLVNQLRKAGSLLGQEPVINIPPHAQPAEKIRVLCQLADQMDELMKLIAGKGVDVPASIIPGVNRYLKLVEAILK